MEPKPETNPLPQSVRDTLFINNTLIDVGLRKDQTIDRRFRNLTDPKIPANPEFVDGVRSYDVTTTDPNWFRVFVPNVSANHKLPVIVYYHGGGLAYYGPDSGPFDGLCRRFASKIEAIVVSASYRLIPEFRYPTQYEDGFNVLTFLDEDTKHRLPKNADLKRVFMFGDSAGANLAHHVCIRAAKYKFKHIRILGLVTLQPYFGGEQRVSSELSSENRLGLHLNQTDFYWNIFQPIATDEPWTRDHEVINVSGPNAADLSPLNWPPTLVVVGGRDILENRQRDYYLWLKNSGKEAYLEEYNYMFHAFYTFPDLPESTHVLSVAKEFMNKQMKLSTRLHHRL